MVSRSTFLHNTKVSSSKANEDKARSEERDKDHPNGRAISHMEMLHTMLRYPEVVTDLKFISICTMPIELRAGLDTENSITKNMDNEMVDGIEVGIISDNIRKENYRGQRWRQHTANEVIILNDASISHISIDKVSQFGCRPPEFRYIFNSLESYFR